MPGPSPIFFGSDAWLQRTESAMSHKVCLSANALQYPEGGGHLWVYLNWALGLRAIGCQVVWLEPIHPSTNTQEPRANITALKHRLERYGLAASLALWSFTGEPVPQSLTEDCLTLEDAAEADLLLSLRHDTRPEVVRRFPRSALVDIDPGILQFWMSKGEICPAPHDFYFTIGETVGQPGSRIPDAGIEWRYTPPCVALEWWQPHQAAPDSSFTTVSQWYMDLHMYESECLYRNDKRAGFLPFLDLPKHTKQPLELALNLAGDEDERTMLEERGWHVREAHAIASTPWDYQRYIQESAGEFGWAKPSYVRLETAWISDRTLCYLASGKPAVVQHSGPSRFLPNAAGLFRFRDLQEAARYLDLAATDYERQSRLARALVEEHFDARKVIKRVLERSLS
jgi:hypothetical protein